MDQQPRDEFTSPLDGVLDNLPEEQPPADLEARCREALRAKVEGARRPRTWTPWRTALAAAASLVVLVGVTSMLMMPAAKQLPASERKQGQVLYGAQAPSASELSQAPAEPADGGMMGGQGAAGPAAGGALALAPPPAGASYDGATDAIASKGMARQEAETTAGARMKAQAQPMGAETKRGYESYKGLGSPRTDHSTPREAAAPAKPWRDESGERQRIVHKEMEVEVRDVERAHEQATSIIEKADGYVDSEEMEVLENERDHAHLVARVPVKALDGVVAQLRRLGKVTRLMGSGEDRTADYVASGTEIRTTAETEGELVARYEKEKNAQRKRQLYLQIQALRERNKARKEQLLRLSDQTHYATLDLTLTEAGGAARQFLKRLGENALKVLTWVGATAVIWLPLLTVGYLLWRRRTAA